MNETLFLCGDVMTGRGIDQALPFPGNPFIYEPYINDARGYINLAHRSNGSFSIPVTFSYIWGDGLEELELRKPLFRLINLETSITESSSFWKGKGINYKMSPANTACLTSAKIDYCALANNHVLDWEHQGLIDTLTTLKNHGIHFSGAGLNILEAMKPAILTSNQTRILVFSIGTESSGIPLQWKADGSRPGVYLLHGLTPDHVHSIGKQIETFKKPGDIIIISIHWGGNWVYKIPPAHIQFAHALIDNGYADIIHGHSSHHILGMEIYKGKPILYGCGDFINDYEGIIGQEEFRGDLSLMYFISLDTTNGNLVNISLVPLIKYQFRLNRISEEDFKYLETKLNCFGEQFKNRVAREGKNAFTLQWNA